MRTSTLSTCLLLLAPAAFCAAPAPSDVLLHIQPLGVDCPIGFSVERRAVSEVLNVGQSSPHRGRERIRLTFSPFRTPSLQRVEIVVHAASPNLQLLPAAAGNGPLPEVDRSFQLRAEETSDLREREIWVDRVGSVRSVDLRSITYADGTSWHPSANSTCRAVPDPFTLVDAH